MDEGGAWGMSGPVTAPNSRREITRGGVGSERRACDDTPTAQSIMQQDFACALRDAWGLAPIRCQVFW